MTAQLPDASPEEPGEPKVTQPADSAEPCAEIANPAPDLDDVDRKQLDLVNSMIQEQLDGIDLKETTKCTMARGMTCYQQSIALKFIKEHLESRPRLQTALEEILDTQTDRFEIWSDYLEVCQLFRQKAYLAVEKMFLEVISLYRSIRQEHIAALQTVVKAGQDDLSVLVQEVLEEKHAAKSEFAAKEIVKMMVENLTDSKALRRLNDEINPMLEEIDDSYDGLVRTIREKFVKNIEKSRESVLCVINEGADTEILNIFFKIFDIAFRYDEDGGKGTEETEEMEETEEIVSQG